MVNSGLIFILISDSQLVGHDPKVGHMGLFSGSRIKEKNLIEKVNKTFLMLCFYFEGHTFPIIQEG